MSANDRQIGGSHYKRGDGRIEHWDLVERYGLGYLEGCATKYVDRWRSKNGLEDLAKAEHYVQKLIELHVEGVRRPRGIVPSEVVAEFCRGKDAVEMSIIFSLCRWDCRAHLEAAQKDLSDLIAVERGAV
jgi:hypothetical protein